jgi:8-amino-7-oxononanoate synthase
VQPIIHPAIPERLARLRFFLSSEHSFDQIETAIGCLAEQLRDAAATPLTAPAPRSPR